ncbi:uncharacterized protein At4g06744 [Dendrobium catenatum]|uniref:Uncharacterized protein n=1 Tax=Dendrobium catenatum TaxID=906689 RepID=A0A2I0VEK5_9ASPA|nr:uncharacterized protein At4g06744 [Dendrobium catenatum]PKU61847.1 Uncharacterized protein MA16_Dca016043 [Dendrobium catenatum]
MEANLLQHPISSSIFLLHAFLCFLLLSRPCNSSSNRQTLQIGIGIGIGGGNAPPSPESEPICPPPPPPPCPPPPSPKPRPPPLPPKPPSPPPGELTPGDFPNLLQYRSYKVIQRFKRTIYSDPMKIISTWNGPDLSKYKGFFLETPPRYKNITPTIASIDFNGFRLGAPTLAGFIDGFPDLALFHANSNGFGGTLPNLTKLPYLYELDFSNNKFSGEFPTAVLPLSNLSFLDLRFNHFAGVVPPSIFLIQLGFLFLNNNLFSQPLPADLGRTGAAYLTLANNGFTGGIPASICEANATLIEVLFLGNQLSGCLPAEIGQLRKATVFDAGFNKITGPIPPTLGCLRKVEQLNFAGNLLYGEIPDEVCKLGVDGGGRLLNLSLSDNYFTSLGKSCLNLLQRGILNIKKNCILGFADQRPPAECALFLARRNYCPWHDYVPCSNEWKNSALGGGNPASSSGYSSYSTLGKN